MSRTAPERQMTTDITQPFQVRCRDSAGAYVTNTINGRRASCTESAAAAASRLAEKLICSQGPERSFMVAAVPGQHAPGTSVWLVTPIRWMD